VSDILSTVPWCCEERDCPNQWHKSTYWCDDDGTYSCDRFTDGDHENVQQDDMPSLEEEVNAWKDYARYVLKTSADPLYEYSVKHTRSVKESYYAQVRRSIAGPRLVLLRRGRTEVPFDEIPQHVLDWLHIPSPSPTASRPLFFINMDWDLFIECPRVHVWKNNNGVAAVRFFLNREIPRSPTAVAADLRKAAQRSLSPSFTPSP